MFRMTGRIKRNKFQITDGYRLRIIRNFELTLRNRQELTPQYSHLIAVDARGAGEQLFGVEQVWRAHRVDENLRALRQPFDQPVVKMCDDGKVVGHRRGDRRRPPSRR